MMDESARITTPVDPYLGRLEDLSGPKLRVHSLGFLAQLNIRAGMKILPDIERECGIRLARELNTGCDTGNWSSLRLGPDEWLLVGLEGSQCQVLGKLEVLAESNLISAVDVSCNRIAIEISGNCSLELLSALTNLSLNLLGPGKCFQTFMERVQVILHWMKSRDCYRIYVRSSFARYLVDVIIDQSQFLEVR